MCVHGLALAENVVKIYQCDRLNCKNCYNTEINSTCWNTVIKYSSTSVNEKSYQLSMNQYFLEGDQALTNSSVESMNFLASSLHSTFWKERKILHAIETK